MKRLLYLFVLYLPFPLSAFADVAETFELQAEPRGGIASNTAIEIVGHNGAVWLATSRGVTFSADAGQSWSTYDTSNGLLSLSVSAMFSAGSRLWIATNHTEKRLGQLFSASDGLFYTDDNGNTWDRVNFGSGGLNIPFVWGIDRTIYDISGHSDTGFFSFASSPPSTDWLFFSAFAGGLLASQDGGTSWRRIYHSAADSAQFNSGGTPSVRNRNFACVVDTSHGDSVFLWTGTAGGLFQYVFVPPREKFYSRRVNRIAFCDTCSADGPVYVFIGGSHGLTRGPLGGPYQTRFGVDGLPEETITALIDVGGNLLVGTVDSVTGETAPFQALAISNDLGNTFSPTNFPGDGSSDAIVSDFRFDQGRLYMAASSAGLLLSTDSGLTWNPVTYGTFGDPANESVNSIAVLDDTLLLGTDAGFLELYTDGAGNIVDSVFTPFVEDDSSSSKIIRIEPQLFIDTLGGLDSTAVWTVHRPVSMSGTPIVGRRGWDIDSVLFDSTIDTTYDTVVDTMVDPPDTTFDTVVDTVYLYEATDTTYVWKHLQVGALVYDVEFIDRAAFVTGEFGVRFTTTGDNPDIPFGIFPGLDTIFTMEARGNGDTVILGGDHGLAFTDDRGLSFVVSLANLDTLHADSVVTFTLNNTDGGITGDFVPVLGVDYQDTGPAHIWASGRPALTGGRQGRSMGIFDKYVIDTIVDTIPDDPLPGDTIFDTMIDTNGFAMDFQTVDSTSLAWNFEFVGDSVFTASTDGLLLDTAGALFATEEVELVNDTIAGNLVDPGTAVFAVEHINPYLWVGTNDGTVRLDVISLKDGKLFARVDSTTSPDEVYAYPVPFRLRQDDALDFHFVVQQSGPVTLEIYDFAMNLVARPIDNVFYQAGIYPDGNVQGRTWDGRNGKGDFVAVGVYYIKFTDGNGDIRWGKLAVLP